MGLPLLRAGQGVGTEAGGSAVPARSTRTGRLSRILLLLLVALMVAVAATGIGAVAIAPLTVLRAVLQRSAVPGTVATIVWTIRLPRIALGLLIGGGLALAGAAYQGVLRNPLADPGVLGVSSGSALGAAAVIYLVYQHGLLSIEWIPAAAFATGLLVVLMVYALARRGGSVSVLSLVLAGVAMGAVCAAVVDFLRTVSKPEVVKAIGLFLSGGLAVASWRHSLLALPYLVVGAAVIVVHARDLNLLALGEAEAVGLGVRVERTKILVLGAATLITAAAVSVTGVIGFVGLLVPHALRTMLGPDHRLLLPASALGGGAFLVFCDTVARAAWPPHDVQVAIITGLCGGPFFLYLLRRRTVRGE